MLRIFFQGIENQAGEIIFCKAKANQLNHSKPKSQTEIEAKIVVYSKRPKPIFSEIGQLEKIDDYFLIPQKTIHIHDCYWDKPDGSLQKNQISFRTRTENSLQFITIKGAAKVTTWGGVKRKEIEVPWSRDGYNEIIEEMHRRGIDLPQVPNKMKLDSSVDVFQNLGFVKVQDRKTERQVRNITSGETHPIWAELVLDTVHYEIMNQIIHHFEIEIELKHINGQKALQSVLNFILNSYKSEIRTWTHSKLAIGKSLEQLLTKETWNKYIDINNNILPETYDKISNILISNKM